MDIDPSAATAAEPGQRSTTLAAGDHVGKYRLDRVIGSGGMGVVWAAMDPDLERAVALKVLHTPTDIPELRTRLLREARAMARLKHPNVVTVYEVGTDANRDYIAMELVEGENLDVWLATKPTRADILDALFGAARGLVAAHDAGLVHRDFKPHNVLRGRDGHVYVTDFGLARGQIEDGTEVSRGEPSASKRPVDAILDSPLTQTGVLIGTPAYMAPEQFAGHAPDPRSDQFAFCVTAWEALTGVRPFRGTTLDELEAAVGSGVSSLAITASLSPRIRAILGRGLEPKPEGRYADVRELVAALETALAPPKRSSWPLIIVGGTLVVVALALVVALKSRSSSTSATAAGECAAPDEAFDSVWSPEQRARVTEPVPGRGYGGVVLLDEIRPEWLRAFRIACSIRPETAGSRDRKRCLLRVRDQLASATKGLDGPDAMVDIGRIAMLGEERKNCDRIDVSDGPGETPPVPPRPPPSSDD